MISLKDFSVAYKTGRIHKDHVAIVGIDGSVTIILPFDESKWSLPFNFSEEVQVVYFPDCDYNPYPVIRLFANESLGRDKADNVILLLESLEIPAVRRQKKIKAELRNE